jgi:hypothetical protein
MALEIDILEWECAICGNLYANKDEAEHCCDNIIEGFE